MGRHPHTRDRRRAHTRRMKARALRVLAIWGLEAECIDARRIGQIAAVRGVCSCWACGNPRRHFGEPSLQERRLEAIWWLADDPE